MANCIFIICSGGNTRECNEGKTYVCENGFNRITPDEAITIDELGDKLKDVKKTIVLIGDGTKVAFNKLKDVLPNITVATASVVYQSAADVCVLAAEKVSVDDFKLTMAHDVLPNYLRLSQAERERLEKMENSKLKM